MKRPVGWRNEPGRHALAARGIETTFRACGRKHYVPGTGGDSPVVGMDAETYAAMPGVAHAPYKVEPHPESALDIASEHGLKYAMTDSAIELAEEYRRNGREDYKDALTEEMIDHGANPEDVKNFIRDMGAGGDWTIRFGDIVGEHRGGITNPENVAIERYIDIMDEATSESQMDDAFTCFQDDLRDEGWGAVEANELAYKLLRAHQKQKKIEKYLDAKGIKSRLGQAGKHLYYFFFGMGHPYSLSTFVNKANRQKVNDFRKEALSQAGGSPTVAFDLIHDGHKQLLDEYYGTDDPDVRKSLEEPIGVSVTAMWQLSDPAMME